MKKEKSDRQMTIMVQRSLYDALENKCQEEHRTVSEVIRELASKYASGWVQQPQPVYTSIQGGLIDPVQPIWGRQGQWVFYKQGENVGKTE